MVIKYMYIVPSRTFYRLLEVFHRKYRLPTEGGSSWSSLSPRKSWLLTQNTWSSSAIFLNLLLSNDAPSDSSFFRSNTLRMLSGNSVRILRRTASFRSRAQIWRILSFKSFIWKIMELLIEQIRLGKLHSDHILNLFIISCNNFFVLFSFLQFLYVVPSLQIIITSHLCVWIFPGRNDNHT